ncbi:hypothetical protein ACVOMV_09080 [Mesorhizobium atlanticum]
MLSNTFPAGPMKGLPARSSWLAGLFADEDHKGVFRPFAEHSLRRVAPERATAAAFRLFAQLRDVFGLWRHHIGRLGRRPVLGLHPGMVRCWAGWHPVDHG